MSIELQSKSTLVIYATVRAIRFMRFFFSKVCGCYVEQLSLSRALISF